MLLGNARKWFKSRPNNASNSCNDARAEFLKLFVSLATTDIAIETLLNRTQLSTELFRKHFYGNKDLCIRANLTMDEHKKGLNFARRGRWSNRYKDEIT